MPNVKNYRKQGGEEWVIGGKQTVESGGELIHDAGSKVTTPIATKTDDYTVLASESGTTFLMGTDAKKFTLPSTANGLRYTFVNSGADGNNNVRVAPAAADFIAGNGLTAVVNKYIDNTKATTVKGDFITIIGATGGWYVVGAEGTWTKEA